MATELLDKASVFISYAATLFTVSENTVCYTFKVRVKEVYSLAIKLAGYIWSEGYCHMLSYLEVA